MAKEKKIRILISDERPVFRAGLRRLLSQVESFTVVGEVEDGRKVVQRVRELKPAVLLLGSVLAGAGDNDFEFLRTLERKHRQTKVIVLASSDQEEETTRTVRRSMAALLSRHAPFRTLEECIRRVHSGEVWLDTSAPKAMRGPVPSLFAPSARPPDISPLSDREKQVVELISQGFKNKEIAERMFISEQTVKNHLHNIFDKLGVSDRLELALYAIHKNLQPSS